jgi:uncharacterized protein DUF5681
MPYRPNHTSFQPGKSGNPAGRRPGSKNVMPRVRDLINAVLEDNVEAVREAYRRAATNPRTVLQCLELAAKLNRELGPGARWRSGSTARTGTRRRSSSRGERLNSMNPNRPDDVASPARPDGATTRSPILRLAGRPRRTRKLLGQPRDEGQVRRLLNEAFRKSRPEVEVALAECFADPKTVLACVELLARLDGELP